MDKLFQDLVGIIDAHVGSNKSSDSMDFLYDSLEDDEEGKNVGKTSK